MALSALPAAVVAAAFPVVDSQAVAVAAEVSLAVAVAVAAVAEAVAADVVDRVLHLTNKIL